MNKKSQWILIGVLAAVLIALLLLGGILHFTEKTGEYQHTGITNPELTTAPVKTTTAPVETTTAPVKTTTAPVETTTAPAEPTTVSGEITTAPAQTTPVPTTPGLTTPVPTTPLALTTPVPTTPPTSQGDVTIETPFYTIRYPGRYQAYLQVETQEGDDYTVAFFAQLSGKKVHLFDIHFGGVMGSPVGILTVEGGGHMDVSITTYSVDAIPGLSQEDQNIAYGMKEAMNDILEDMRLQ